MKSTSLFILTLGIIFLIACEGSKTYRGDWKATNVDGTKFELHFDAKSLSIKDSTGTSKKYSYTQNAIETVNGRETYGLQIETGQQIKIYFPLSSDESVAIIQDENKNPIYYIARKKFITSSDISNF